MHSGTPPNGQPVDTATSFVITAIFNDKACVRISTDLASKSARIVVFCGTSSGLVDFENTVDRGSAVNFGADSGLCLS